MMYILIPLVALYLTTSLVVFGLALREFWCDASNTKQLLIVTCTAALIGLAWPTWWLRHRA